VPVMLPPDQFKVPVIVTAPGPSSVPLISDSVSTCDAASMVSVPELISSSLAHDRLLISTPVDEGLKNTVCPGAAMLMTASSLTPGTRPVDQLVGSLKSPPVALIQLTVVIS